MAPTTIEVIIGVFVLLMFGLTALLFWLVVIGYAIARAREKCNRMFCRREEWLERTHYYD